MAELQLEGVRTVPDPIDVMEEPHVPDIEIRGEEAVRVILQQYFFWESCPE